MNTNLLLSKGYFPKELPPGFTTEIFGQKSSYVSRRWNRLMAQVQEPLVGESNNARKLRVKSFEQKYGSSGCVKITYPKSILSRRQLDIPNPKQFHDLSNIIVSQWNDLKSVYRLSNFSSSLPVELEAPRAVRTKSRTFNEFQFNLISKSYNRGYELRVDISQFYPTIYTHSIPWALLSKPVAKRYFGLKNSPNVNWTNVLATDPIAANYANADQLDTLIRNCQEKQSVGLPIGPDTSFLLAEAIGCRMDAEIERLLIGIDFDCLRYYDDYYFYTDTYSGAEKISKVVQNVFTDFQLKINEQKLKIEKSPISHLPNWSVLISNFHFYKVDKFSLRSYFSLLLNQAYDFPSESNWIIQYGLNRFQFGNVIVPKAEWGLFLHFLLKVVQIDASNIDQVFKIMYSYEEYIDEKSKKLLTNVLERLLVEHLNLHHSFEISWILWIVKSFDLRCQSLILEDIMMKGDGVSKIVCLDIISTNNYSGKRINLINIANTLVSADLWTENWLFTYESICQNWLTPAPSVISDHEYFQILKHFNVRFYDSNRQLVKDFRLPRRENDFGELFGDHGDPQPVIVVRGEGAGRGNRY